jgi:hypothetical protein
MKMRENLIDIYKVFTTNETLLRLLYYKPVDASDDPLDPTKENILDKADKWDIIMDRIVTTPKVDDLDNTEKCRLLFYPGRRSNTSSYILADQEVVVDVLVNFNYDNVDLRLSWVCDTVNSLMFDKRITGVGKITYKSGSNVSAPSGYVGYRLTYEIGSVKK